MRYHPLAQLTPQGQTGSPRTWPSVHRVMCPPVPVCGRSCYQPPSAWSCTSAKGSKRATGTFLRNPGLAQLFPKLAPVRTGLLSLASWLQPRHSAGLQGCTSGVAAGPGLGSAERVCPGPGGVPGGRGGHGREAAPGLSSGLGCPHCRDAQREQSSAVVCLRYRCFWGAPPLGCPRALGPLQGPCVQ